MTKSFKRIRTLVLDYATCYNPSPHTLSAMFAKETLKSGAMKTKPAVLRVERSGNVPTQTLIALRIANLQISVEELLNPEENNSKYTFLSAK